MAAGKRSGLTPAALGFARSGSYSNVELQKTERGLEKEIRRESSVPPPGRKLARLRHKGERILHSKHVLLLVVILNIVDCGLVLGELILDIHYIRELRGETERVSQHFIHAMEARYPDVLHGHTLDSMNMLYQKIYEASCNWPSEAGTDQGTNTPNYVHSNSSDPDRPDYDNRFGFSFNRNRTNTSSLNEQWQTSAMVMKEESNVKKANTLWEDIAHGMHKASITILGILFVENLVKLFCMGRGFFSKKLEVFDSLVVFVSFVVDLVLLKGLTEFPVQDALFILSFLLPWRAIRVVNSLIVAILDHEHFRLKMLYKEKKIVNERLRVLKDKEKRWEFHLQKIESFCESEGIPKWKIRQHTAMGRKQSTITSMASLALNGFLQGMILSSPDKDLFNQTLERSIAISNSCDPPDRPSEASGSGLNSVSAEEKNHEVTLRSKVKLKDIASKNHGDVTKGSPKTKRVSFDGHENKPLLLRQDSLDTDTSAPVDDNKNIDSDASNHTP